jgi:hypothetical protein
MATAPVENPAPEYRIHLRRSVGGAVVTPNNSEAHHYVTSSFPDSLPAEGTDAFSCKLEVAPGVVLQAVAWGGHVFVGNAQDDWRTWALTGRNKGSLHQVDEPFITARIVKPAHTQIIKKRRQVRDSTSRYHGNWKYEDYEGTDTYNLNSYHSRTSTPQTDIPYAYFHIEISSEGAEPVVGSFKFQQPDFGKAVLVPGSDLGEVTITTDFFGMTRSWSENLAQVTTRSKRYPHQSYYDENKNNPFQVLTYHLQHSECPDEADAWWAEFLRHQAVSDGNLDMRGLAAVFKRKAIKPSLDKLATDSPVNWAFFRWLCNGRTRNKIKVNTLLATMLKHIGADFDKLDAALTAARATALEAPTSEGYRIEQHADRWLETKQYVAKTLPGGKERVEEQEAKRNWRKRKTAAGKADGLGITVETAPKLRKAIESGAISAVIFDQPSSGYKEISQPVNREYALWEKALKRKGWAPVLSEIAADAAGRKQYERDITPYIAFLFRIEKYLRRHTGKHWKAVPKFVNSQWELEMDEPTDGTTKRRSAFTPVADNETRTITVPYVAVVVGGRMAQWCYSQHYYVFEEGMTDPESMGIVVNEIEEKLNGRDDYGLMYFTLTGTVTARGYPTFLIIFERLKAGTRVHFHRVHPKRSTKGIKTPACELVAKCYAYMAGNVPASDVAAQQGDLIFIRHGNDPIKAGAKVAAPQESPEGLVFESHAMTPLWAGIGDNLPKFKLFVSEAKTPKNRLGFLWAPGEFAVKHPEHDDIECMGEGWWEIRRCRSWEANPKAIWSLTID